MLKFVRFRLVSCNLTAVAICFTLGQFDVPMFEAHLYGPEILRQSYLFSFYAFMAVTLFSMSPLIEKRGVWAYPIAGAACGFLCSILALVLIMLLGAKDYITAVTYIDVVTAEEFLYSFPYNANRLNSWVQGAVLFTISGALLFKYRTTEKQKLGAPTKTICWLLALSPILLTKIVFLERFYTWHIYDVSSFEYQTPMEFMSIPVNAEEVTAPTWIPSTAKNIKVSHNNDKTDIWIEFSFAKSDHFYNDCLKLRKKDLYLIDQGRAAGIEFSRYPDFVTKMLEAIHHEDVAFFRCNNNNNYILAINPNEYKGYIWKYKLWDYLDYKKSFYKNSHKITIDRDGLSPEIIPTWLPASAESITTLHHADANETLIFFSFLKEDAFYKNCSKIDRRDAQIPDEEGLKRLSKYNYDYVCSNLIWMTSDMPKYYRCDDNKNRFLYIDHTGQNGIAWENLKYSAGPGRPKSVGSNFMDPSCSERHRH